MKSRSKYFVIVYTPGERWIKGEPVYNQPLNEHAGYLQNLLDKGVLIMGGPFDLHPGGLAIIKAKNSSEGNIIVKEDPAVRNKIFKADLIRWECYFRLV